MCDLGDGLYSGFNSHVGDFGDCKIPLSNPMIANGSLKDEHGDTRRAHSPVSYKVFPVMASAMMVHLSVSTSSEATELIGRVAETNTNICSSKIFFIKVSFIAPLCA